MRIYSLLFTGIMFCCSLMAIAQNTNPLDKQNKPSDNSVFGPNQKKAPSSGLENANRPRNMFKLPLADLLRTEVSLKYELKFGSHLSATAMGGVPLGKDPLEVAWRYMAETNTSTNMTEENCIPFTVVQESSAFESGIQYSFSLKYYPLEEDNASMFYELGFKNVKRNYLITAGPYTTNGYSDNMKYFLFSVGTLWVNGKHTIKFTHEASFGLGFKVVYWDTYTEKKFVNEFGEYQYSEYNKNLKQAYYYTPYLSLRYNIGFGL